MRGLILCLGFVLVAGAAGAADQPAYGPPADWVKPLEIPEAGADTTTPTRMMLENIQDRFETDAQDSYFESAVKIQTPQGLTSVGNIAFNWKPDTDTLTIHKARIIRGDQTIDLLADGHAFTVLRRENNLEMAMLDGAMTAVIQPEGLQIGDILNVAITLRRSDPVLQGHSQRLTGNIVGAPVDHLSIRETWPKAKPLRWRQTDGLAPAKITTAGAEEEELSIEMNSTVPPVGPKGAPPRFFQLGELEGSEFKSWADVSALMAPLFRKAAMLAPQSPLKAEAAKIKSMSGDPKTQAMAALKLVEDQIRYFFLGMNNGGYMPADADQTWSRRFGDCKGKTAILIALLRELGIEAEPALASVMHGDGLDERLPMLEVFDHVLVRAVIGGKAYWLDATRSGDRNLDDLPVPGFHWLLPVQESGATLVKLTTPAPDKPLIATELHLDASGGLDAPVPAHAAMRFRGDSAIFMKLQLANVARADAEKYLRELWKKSNNDLEVTQVDFQYDDSTGEEVLSMDGTANMRWSTSGEGRRYEIDHSAVGFKADFTRDPASKQDAPFALIYPYYSENTETILLPWDGAGFTIEGADASLTLGSTALLRKASIAKGTFTFMSSVKTLAPEFPASEAKGAETVFRQKSKEVIYLVAPKPYAKSNVATGENLTSLPTIIDEFLGRGAPVMKEPTTEDEFINHGYQLMKQKDWNLAIVEFNHALDLNPSSVLALADRGICYFWKGDIDRASVEFDKAIQINPQSSTAFQGRGLVFARKGDDQAAIDAFTHAIEIKPDDLFSLERRAFSYQNIHDADKALADFDNILRLNPNRKDIYARRAAVFISSNQGDKALENADAFVAADADNPAAHWLRGIALKFLGRKDEAATEYARSLELKPTVEVYLDRAQLNTDNPKESLADINRAIELNPKSASAFIARAGFYGKSGDLSQAIADSDEAVNLMPEDFQARITRAELFAKNRQYDLALKDIEDLISKSANNPVLLNDRCWYRAISGQGLTAALADCDTSLKIREMPDALDSRGFVYLRLGRLDQAIGDYDAALKLRPQLAASLFGRGIARLRKGVTAEGQADLTAARTIDPEIDETYAAYGVTP